MSVEDGARLFSVDSEGLQRRTWRRTCVDCGERKDASEFYKCKTGREGLSTYCKKCSIKRARARQVERGDDWLLSRKVNRYGITEQQIWAALDEQQGRCAICQVSFADKPYRIDHCHETGAFRGLLCDDCNTSIGKFGDDLHGVLAAVTYLLRAGRVGEK